MPPPLELPPDMVEPLPSASNPQKYEVVQIRSPLGKMDERKVAKRIAEPPEILTETTATAPPATVDESLAVPRVSAPPKTPVKEIPPVEEATAKAPAVIAQVEPPKPPMAVPEPSPAPPPIIGEPRQMTSDELIRAQLRELTSFIFLPF